MTEVRGPFSEHLKGPHPPAGHGTAEPRLDSSGRSAVTWRSRARVANPTPHFGHLALNLSRDFSLGSHKFLLACLSRSLIVSLSLLVLPCLV
jgi:hypothetical protein